MILLIDVCRNPLHRYEFVTPVKDIVSETSDYDIKDISKIDKIKKYEKIIICGTALKDNDFVDYWERFVFLKNTDVPVLGICAGMQIIGMVFGAKRIKCKEIGVSKIDVVKNSKIIDKGKIRVYELHSFSTLLPKGFVEIAKNRDGVQVMKHREKEIYGVCFHPEVLNKEIIRQFVLL